MSNNDDFAGAGNSCQMSQDAALYVAGEMDSAQMRDFEQHLAECDDCRDHVDAFGRVVETLKSDPTIPIKADLTGRIMSRIADKPRGSMPVFSDWFSLPVMLRAAAALVILLAGALFVQRVVGPSSMPLDGGDSIATSNGSGVIGESLGWLVRTQESDGSWEPSKWEGKKEYKVGLTGMALLALLQGGQQESRPESHRAALDSALDYILSQQSTTGHFGAAQDGLMYNHGIASVAALEAYRATGDSRLKEPIDRAIDFTRRSQLNDGGWGYWGQENQGPNTSISVWQLQALCRARDLGWEDTTRHLHAGLLWLRSMVDDTGMVGYRKIRDFPSGTDSLSAMGAYCFLTASLQLDNWHQVGNRVREALLKTAPTGRDNVDFYRSYFIASALKTAPASRHTPELSGLQKSLLDLRVTSGVNTGTWNPAGPWAAAGGRIYATTMATLSL